jgi:hypothetical protein
MQRSTLLVQSSTITFELSSDEFLAVNGFGWEGDSAQSQ